MAHEALFYIIIIFLSCLFQENVNKKHKHNLLLAIHLSAYLEQRCDQWNAQCSVLFVVLS